MFLKMRALFIGATAAFLITTGFANVAAAQTFATGLTSHSLLQRDNNGDLLVGAQNSMPIRIVTPGGVVSTRGATLSAPNDIVRGPDGALYISEQSGSRILRSTDNGVTTSVYATGTIATFGMAFGPGGQLYVANNFNGTILVVPPGGGAASLFATVGSSPRGLVYSGNSLYVASSGELEAVTVPGAVVSRVAFFGQAYGVTLDGAGALYVSDRVAGTVERVTPAGVKTPVASGLTQPQGVAFNTAGDLFVSSGAGIITRFNAVGAPVGPRPVPTLSEWAMILFGLMLAGGATLYIQYRRTVA
ncbi:IPTL-CTERM sorting domain-containing protein [Brevundimonas sp.]|uniref:IPTL-CTERM sorting domain-containing protein n=1 Tax=Brevundimonas sp. TaxID=1871086 RepID=UPI003D112FCF